MMGRDHGYGGKGKSLTALDESVLVIARQNRFHPVRDWLNGLEWDGQNHIARFMKFVQGSQDTITYETGDGKAVQVPAFQIFLTRWMMQAVGKALDPGVRSRPCWYWSHRRASGKAILRAGFARYRRCMSRAVSTQTALTINACWLPGGSGKLVNWVRPYAMRPRGAEAFHHSRPCDVSGTLCTTSSSEAGVGQLHRHNQQRIGFSQRSDRQPALHGCQADSP